MQGRKARAKVKRVMDQKEEKGGPMPMGIGQVNQNDWGTGEISEMSFSFGSGQAGHAGWIGEVTKDNAQIEEVGTCEAGWEKCHSK